MVNISQTQNILLTIFTLFFRDDTPHIYNNTYLNQEKVLEIISDITDLLQGVFPNTTVYSALGNHDWSPKSQLPPRPDPFYDRIAEKWSNWITETQAGDTFKKGNKLQSSVFIQALFTTSEGGEWYAVSRWNPKVCSHVQANNPPNLSRINDSIRISFMVHSHWGELGTRQTQRLGPEQCGTQPHSFIQSICSEPLVSISVPPSVKVP